MASPILVAASMTCLALGIPGASAAQTSDLPRQGKLSLGVSIGTTVFSGAARGTGEDGQLLRFIPYRPTMFGLSIGYGREGLRLEVAAAIGEPGLAIQGVDLGDQLGGSGLLVVSENAFRVRSLAGGASARLLRLRGGPVLRATVALLVERWTQPESPARTIVGGQSGLAMEVALTGSLVARAEGIIGLTPASPFRAEDMPEGFRTSTTWRRSLAVGVNWRP